MKEAVFLVLSVSAGLIAFLMAWALSASRPLRIALMASVPEPPRNRLASLSATLWLFPAMFALGCLRNLALAVHLHPWPVNALLSLVMVLAAFHLARAAILLRWVIRRERMG